MDKEVKEEIKTLKQRKEAEKEELFAKGLIKQHIEQNREEYRLYYNSLFVPNSRFAEKCPHFHEGTRFRSVFLSPWIKRGKFEFREEICLKCSKSLKKEFRVTKVTEMKPKNEIKPEMTDEEYAESKMALVSHRVEANGSFVEIWQPQNPKPLKREKTERKRPNKAEIEVIGENPFVYNGLTVKKGENYYIISKSPFNGEVLAFPANSKGECTSKTEIARGTTFKEVKEQIRKDKLLYTI